VLASSPLQWQMDLLQLCFAPLAQTSRYATEATAIANGKLAHCMWGSSLAPLYACKQLWTKSNLWNIFAAYCTQWSAVLKMARWDLKL